MKDMLQLKAVIFKLTSTLPTHSRCEIRTS